MTEYAIASAARKAELSRSAHGHSHSHSHGDSHSHADESESEAFERFESLHLQRSREWRRELGEAVTAINEILDEIRADGLDDDS